MCCNVVMGGALVARPLYNMKTLLIFISIFGSIIAQETKESIPENLANFLDDQYGMWEIYDNSKLNKYPYPFKKSVNYIEGDFNCDNKIDYAMMLERYVENDTLGILISVHSMLNGEFQLFELEKRNNRFGPEEILILVQKGTEDYSYDTDDVFNYSCDAILFYYYECCGQSYVFNDSNYVKIQTVD